MAKSPNPAPCSIDGCERPAKGRGWCGTHHERWRNHGDPTHYAGTPKGALLAWIAQVVGSETDECLVWPFKARASGGYGAIRYKGKATRAHRVALMLSTGEDGAGLEAAHAPGICHNRLCCNPRHLRWATRSENTMDRLIDGTHNRGERNHRAKLTEADVLAIRVDNRPRKAIAAQYGVKSETVSAIKARFIWSWLELENQ